MLGFRETKQSACGALGFVRTAKRLILLSIADGITAGAGKTVLTLVFIDIHLSTITDQI